MAYTSREAFFAFRRSPLLTALSIATIAFALYTLSVFAEVDLPNARKEARQHLRECERPLPGLRRSTETGKRRALVLERVLERHS